MYPVFAYNGPTGPRILVPLVVGHPPDSDSLSCVRRRYHAAFLRLSGFRLSVTTGRSNREHRSRAHDTSCQSCFAHSHSWDVSGRQRGGLGLSGHWARLARRVRTDTSGQTARRRRRLRQGLLPIPCRAPARAPRAICGADSVGGLEWGEDRESSSRPGGVVRCAPPAPDSVARLHNASTLLLLCWAPCPRTRGGAPPTRYRRVGKTAGRPARAVKWARSDRSVQWMPSGRSSIPPCYRFRLATHTIMRLLNKGRYGRDPGYEREARTRARLRA